MGNIPPTRCPGQEDIPSYTLTCYKNHICYKKKKSQGLHLAGTQSLFTESVSGVGQRWDIGVSN